MKKALLTLTAYAALLTNPAYVQISDWTNATLDTWAEQRVGMSRAAADEFTQLASAMPEYLKAPLPEKKP